VSARKVLVDAGGIALPDGRRLREGHALRVSGGLTRAEELGQLSDAGIVQLVDLRGGDEDRAVLSDWAGRHGVAYAHHPIRGGNLDSYRDELMGIETQPEAEQFQLDLYLQMVDTFPHSIAGALDLLGEAGPVGFGCAAGKDRTGIVTAFLHVLLGFSEAAATAYYVSLAPTPEALRPLAEAAFDLAPDDPWPPGVTAMLGVRESLLFDVFAHLRDEHGGLEAYLRAGGFPDDGAERLRARLIAT
jgi:protein-tyrosine phosphatase